VPRDTGGEQHVLERILALRQLAHDDAVLASEAKARHPLTLVALYRLLGDAQRVQLLAREEVRVAGDDRRLLRRLLLPHAYGARLLRALEEIGGEPLLERLGTEQVDRHGCRLRGLVRNG